MARTSTLDGERRALESSFHERGPSGRSLSGAPNGMAADAGYGRDCTSWYIPLEPHGERAQDDGVSPSAAPATWEEPP